MNSMPAALRGVLLTAIVLLCVIPSMGQARGERGNRARPSAPAAPPAPRAEATTPRGPGTVAPPNQGYVVMPESAPAGTARPALIPSDPLDRGYWELYDADKQVTLSGKVTKVTWTNPNTYIFIEASGTEWAIESSFIQFRQSSVNPAVGVDHTITVFGYLPKDEPSSVLPAKISPSVSSYLKEKHLIRAGEITTVYGQKLAMGKPPSEKEMAERLKCSALGC